MTSWSIDPDGVLRVILDVQTRTDELATATGGVISGFDTFAAGAGGLLGEATAELGGLIESQQSVLDRAGARINACTNGAVVSTNAYLAADEEMAATSARAAVEAAASGDLTPLEPYL